MINSKIYNKTMRRNIIMILTIYFKDEKKAEQWMDMPNLLLGGLTPNYMIDIGNIDKLKKAINTMIKGERP